MLIWVNKKKARREVKRAWNAFMNNKCGKCTGTSSVQDCLRELEVFGESMANIAWMLGIHDSTPPSEWDDC